MLSVCPSSVKGACTIKATALPCQPDHLALQGLESGLWLGTPYPPTYPPRPSWGHRAGRTREMPLFFIRGEACLGWRSPAWGGPALPLTPSLHRARGAQHAGGFNVSAPLPARRRAPLQVAQSPGVSGGWAVTLRRSQCCQPRGRPHRRGPPAVTTLRRLRAE